MSLIRRLIDDGHVSTKAPQIPPNRDLGIYQNPFPRQDNNVNQVSGLASSSRQVMYDGNFPSNFMGMMDMEPIYVATLTDRGDDKVPHTRENRT